MDYEWSGAKEALFRGVIRVPRILGERLPWRYQNGHAAFTQVVRRNKSTSLFKIHVDLLESGDAEGIARKAIARVHEYMGPQLDDAWRRWWNESGREFIEGQCRVPV